MAELNNENRPIKTKEKLRILTKNQETGEMELTEQGKEDTIFANIHQLILQNIQNTQAIDPSCLSSVDRFSKMEDDESSCSVGYSYSFVDSTKPFNNRRLIEVDEKGNIIEVYNFK